MTIDTNIQHPLIPTMRFVFKNYGLRFIELFKLGG